MDNKQRVTITLSPGIISRVDRLAELRDCSRSQMMEILMETGIEDAESTMDKLASPLIGPIVQSVLDHPKLVNMLAAAIGDRLSHEELAEWQELAPKVRKVRGKLKDAKGRRNDLGADGA